ncbi:MAG: DUF502 domain-containing protein [Bacteroidetes bacterium]|nr:DUF502 domain-containing protein [Bacteroidota bacterium]
MNKFLKYLLQGILLIVPLAITLAVIFKVLRWIDNIIPDDFISLDLPVLGKFSVGNIPGIGILILVVSLTLLGYLGSTFIARPFIKYFQRILTKAPLIKVIYTSIKDLLGAFVGKEKKFNHPVMVRMGDNNLHKLGFITQENLTLLGIDGGYTAVYFPHSYAFSGNLFIVENKNIIQLNSKSADVMKFIISGGVTSLNKEEEKIQK